MAGASGFGAFAGGLWQGASSAMQLANAYRQYQISAAYSEAADATAAAMAGGQDQTQAQAAQPAAPPTAAIAAPAQPAAPDTSGQLDRERQAYGAPAAPAQPATTTVQGPVSPATTKAAPAPKAPPKQAITPPTFSSQADQDKFITAYATALAAQSAQTTATGATTPLATPPGPAVPSQAEQSQQTGLPLAGSPAAVAAPAIGGAPFNAAGVRGAPGTQSGAPVTTSPPTTAPAQTGPRSAGPNVPSQPALTAPSAQPPLLTDLTHRPYVVPGPAVPPASQQSEELGLPITGATVNRAVPPMNRAVPGTAGVQGLPGSPSGPAQRATIPPPTPVFGPGAQATPPSATARILAATNPQAVSGDVAAIQAGMTNAQPGAGVQTAGPPGMTRAMATALDQAKQTNKPVPIGTTGQVANPDGSVTRAPATQQPAAPAVVNGAVGGNQPIAAPHPPVTPATPPTTRVATALPPTPPPVATPAKVAPAQPAPSQQSETTPPAGPQISHEKFDGLSKQDQDMLTRVAAQDGQGMVSPYQLAWTWYRESRFSRGNTALGDVGTADGPSYGPFQIKKATWDTLDPHHEIDATTLEGGAQLAARYYAHIAQSGYPAFSPAQSAAYMAGEAGARNWNNLKPEQKGWVGDMYPGLDAQRDAWTNLGQTRSDHDTSQAVINAGNRFGPNGTLQAVIDTAGGGVPLSQKWRIAEASTVRAMIMSGHPEAIGQVQEWFAQQSHQGALSNLYAGYQALRGGSPETAVQFFAKAHAFFPDGTFARFGVDKDHVAWGQLLDENTHQPIGSGFKITPDAVQEEMMRIVHPANFMDKLLDMRAKSAEIMLHQAQTGYYLQRPGLQQSAIDERAREADARLAESGARLQQSQQSHEDAVQQQLDADRRPIDASVTKRYDETDPNAVPRAQGETDDQYGARSQIEAALRYPRRAGGAGMATKPAENLASQMVQGKVKLVHGTDKSGNSGYSIHDANEKDPSEANSRGFVDEERGEMLSRLPGVLRRPGAATMPPNTQQHAAIGAGAGTPYAMMQGLGTSYGGVQTIPLQQPQQPQQAIG